MHRAKVIEQAGNQCILLPPEFRVHADEVHLKKTPEGFLVIVPDPWAIFLDGVEELSDEFMCDGRRQPQLQKRRRVS